jgi:hypothetical protein
VQKPSPVSQSITFYDYGDEEKLRLLSPEVGNIDLFAAAGRLA